MWTIVFFLPLKNWDILMFARCKVQVIFSNIHVTGVWASNQKRHISKTAPKGAYGLEGNFDICANILSWSLPIRIFFPILCVPTLMIIHKRKFGHKSERNINSLNNYCCISVFLLEPVVFK